MYSKIRKHMHRIQTNANYCVHNTTGGKKVPSQTLLVHINTHVVGIKNTIRLLNGSNEKQLVTNGVYQRTSPKSYKIPLLFVPPPPLKLKASLTLGAFLLYLLL